METVEHDRKQFCDMHDLYVFDFAVTKNSKWKQTTTLLWGPNAAFPNKSNLGLPVLLSETQFMFVYMIFTAGMRWLNSPFFVWPSNVVLQVWISVFTAANFLLSVKVMFFAGFCEGVKLRTACRVLGFSLADGWYVGSTGNRFGTSQTGYTVGACEATEKTMWSGKRILQVVAL